MKTISEYQKRFYQLMESTIGDVKPLLNEDSTERNGGENGNLESSELVSIGDGENKMHIESWPYFKKMKEEAKKEGIDIKLTGPSGSGYRIVGSPEKGCSEGFTQWCAWQRYGKKRAAYPGTSNHGWGMAIDVESYQAKQWVRENGPKYGWVWGEAPNEDWHFTFCKNNRYRYRRCDDLLKDVNYTEDMIEEQSLYNDVIASFKTSWSDKIEKPIKQLFNIDSYPKPEMIKINEFKDLTQGDYHTFFEYGNITYLGENNVEISLFGERSETEDKPSKIYFLIRKTDKNGNKLSGSEDIKIGETLVSNADNSIISQDANQAKESFIELCREDKKYPYGKENSEFNPYNNSLGI